MTQRMLPALAVLNVLLALVLVFLWLAPDRQAQHLRWTPPQPQTTDYASMLPNLPPVQPVTTGQFVAMLDRPLFTSTRRPPPPPEPKAAAASDSLSSARLTGVFVGSGDGGVIIQLAGKDRRVRLREQVDGWTLSAVDARSATFTSGSGARTLQLLRGNLASYTGQSPTVAPPQPQIQPQPIPAPAAPAQPASGAKPSPVFGGSIR